MSTPSQLPAVVIVVALIFSVISVVQTDAGPKPDTQSAPTDSETPLYTIESVSVVNTHPTDHRPLPAEQASTSRRRRSGDKRVSSSNAAWRMAIEDQLNGYRRTVDASNMYYASWNRGLEASVASLVSMCKIRTQVDVPSQYSGASGLTGLMNPSSDMSAELRQIFLQGPNSLNHQQMIQWSMTGFACAIGGQQCSAIDQRTNQTVPVKLFACLFYYRRPASPNLYAYNGLSCSLCDVDTLWCDRGLCRGSSSCQTGDEKCNRCKTSCSDCRRATCTDDCQCVCYYDSGLTGNGTQRCSNLIESSQFQPMCQAPDDHDQSTGGRGTRVASIVIPICSALLIISTIMFIGYRVQQCKKRPVNPSSGQTQYNDVTYGGSPVYDHDTSGVKLNGSSISPLPSYDDIKPPAYCLNDATAAAGKSVSFDDVILKAGQRTTDNVTASADGTQQFGQTTSTYAAHDNAAYSEDENK